ncbi:beta-galactosidase [Cohnella sp. GCM10012308]|uniref:glycoside hydrolase family 35 protein n=1 Tax=Cohnella sp. GCM10012308 TaxID=3317329 RepID=UPI00362066F2
MATFTVSGDQFAYEGRPVRLLSGAIHYFRVVPEYWRDRLLKLKACGLNTVETYVAWNVHEPEEGSFVFDGIADLEAFVRLAGELGLHVIVRPSPYICAEWEFGGLPAWLLADDNMRLRCYDKAYLAKVDAYFDELLPRLRPLLCTNGGPIVALQVENEYGSYGNDKAYLEYVRDGMIARGMDVLLFTSDGPEDHMLQGGMIDGLFATVNFGSRAAEAFAKLREYQPEGPLMCMEFWNGWFDHWMEPHQSRPASEVADTLEEMLGEGASVNFYMFHGGTNFGFLNGANHIARYEPTVGSYDYDTLLSESGEPTAKFYAVREVLERYAELPPLELPAPLPKRAYGEVAMTGAAPLFAQLDALSAPVRRPCPEPMEKLGQAYGFILYSTTVRGPRSGMELVLQEVRDRALVFADGAYIGTVERWSPTGIPLEVPAAGMRLDILVENMGRVNYGPLLRDPKGITCGVRLGNQFLYDWEIRCLPLSELGGLTFAASEAGAGGQASHREQDLGRQAPASSTTRAGGTQPTFYRGIFRVDDRADTFLRLDGWTKGQAFLNGFNLGRYWEAGPTRTLYIPAPLLREGDNELVVFELHGTAAPVATLTDRADLG